MRANRAIRATALVIAAALASFGVAQAQWSPELAKEWEKYRLARQQQTLDRTERDLRQMEAAYLRGDCVGLEKIKDDLVEFWRGLYSTALLTTSDQRASIEHTAYDFISHEQIDAFSERLNEISRRPCPPGSSNQIESVLDDLTPVVPIIGPGLGETAQSRAAEAAEGSGRVENAGKPEKTGSAKRVENLREELEAGRRREAERRQKELRQQLKPEEKTLLDLHNRARAQVGVPPLQWDPRLAAQAASYGPVLAQHGRPVHSSRKGRETSRENLLQALPGTSIANMIAVWTAERKHFVPGIFPDVSSTGNWADVGHYTQMVWPATTHVGCAVHRGGRFDWLICRYTPPGNQDGKALLSSAPAPPSS